MALSIALGGGAYAAATVVVNGSLTGVDVNNESIRSVDVSGLRANDFAAGQLKAGATGPQGPQGLKGDQGIPGPIAGTPAGGVLSGTYPNPASRAAPSAPPRWPRCRERARMPASPRSRATAPPSISTGRPTTPAVCTPQATTS